MASRDRPLLESLQKLLGYGSITDHPPGRDHWQPTSAFVINSRIGNRTATIPFCDRYLLPPTAKRKQFESWREAFATYEAANPSRYGRGRSICSIEGCDKPVRGRGVCRSHYYQLTGY